MSIRYQEEHRSRHTGFAQVCAVLANIHRDKKKRKKPFTVADFMPKGGPEDQGSGGTGSDWKTQLAFVEQLNQMFGGKDLRKKKG